jgi:hypothetical protein
MRTSEQALKACPTCGQSIANAHMGLRDYQWLKGALPNKVGPTDIDFVLDQSKSGRALIIEFKRFGQGLPLGQRIALRKWVQLGFELWVVWHGDELSAGVAVGPMDKYGEVDFIQKMTVDSLRDRIGAWWARGYQEAA